MAVFGRNNSFPCPSEPYMNRFYIFFSTDIHRKGDNSCSKEINTSEPEASGNL